MSDREVTSLGIEISTDGVVKADKALRQLTQTSKEATAGAKGLEKAWADSERRVKSEAFSRGATLRREQVRAAAASTAATIRAEKERAVAQANELRRSLATQREIIHRDELERRRIILSNTEITERERRALLRRSAAKSKADLAAARGGPSLGRQLVGAAAPLVGAAVLFGGVREVINVNREYDKLGATLITVTGSAENARAAFSVLQEVASTTPYTLQQIVDAYTKLNAYGLNPSERALRSYGDTAAAMGKDLLQMVEAVADAQTGEFERLKEFGIRASAQGDQVKFTFKGVSTTVGKNAREIENYLIKLGEINFAGAMAERMKTLDGALSNLGDEWSKLLRTIGESSVGDLIKESVTAAISAVKSLSEFLKSDTANAFVDWVKKARVYVAGAADIGLHVARAPLDPLTYASLPGKVGQARDTVASLQNDLAGEVWQRDLYARLEKENNVFGLGGQATQTAGLPSAYADYAPSPKGGKSKAQLAAAKKAQAERNREEDRARREADQRYRKALQEDKALRAQRQKEIDAEIKQEVEAADKIKEALQKPGERRTRQYQSEMATLDRGAASDETKARLTKQYERDMEQIRRGEEEKRQVLWDEYKTEEQQLADAQAKKRQMIDDARSEELISAEEHAALLLRLQKDTLEKQRALDAARVESSLTSAAAIFGGVASTIKNVGGEESAVYKTMFATQKAFAIASATVSMQKSIADALGTPWPGNIPLMLQAAAQGASILSQITATNYSGAYDAGGLIPAGSVGLVGERGPEFVRGPAAVTSRRDTAAAMGGGVTVVVAPDQKAAEQYMTGPDGQRALLAMIHKNSAAIRRIVG